VSELPTGWVSATVEDLLTPLEDGRLIHQGWSPQCEREPAPDDAWGVLKTTAIQAGEFLPGENKLLPASLKPRPALEVRAGDLLLTCAGPRARCGVACLVRETPPYRMLSGKMYRFRVNREHVDPSFFEYLLLSPDQVDAIDEIKTGISDSGLNLTHARFKGLEVPLAPRAEQARIVAAIEEAFSKLDAGEAGLRTVRRLLTRMRNAILTAALTGHLVPQNPADSAAVKLLADLGAEAAAPNCVPDLPPSWAWTELGAIAEVVGGVTKDSKRQSDASFVEVPYLRVANVQRGFLDLSSITTIRVAPEKAAQLELQSGDVLFNEGGDRDKLGRGWVWEGQIFRCIHQNHVFRARLFGGLESKLVSIWGNTYGREWFENRGKQTTNLASLNLRTLKAFPVPIAPVEEQRRILAEVERQMSFLEACERAVEVGLSRSTGLRRSVLKAAFEGRLTPQDPSDEPASVLLDRIRAERTAHSVAKQRARQRP
jgi:type I restriction enzyme S subunit